MQGCRLRRQASQPGWTPHQTTFSVHLLSASLLARSACRAAFTSEPTFDPDSVLQYKFTANPVNRTADDVHATSAQATATLHGLQPETEVRMSSLLAWCSQLALLSLVDFHGTWVRILIESCNVPPTAQYVVTVVALAGTNCSFPGVGSERLVTPATPRWAAGPAAIWRLLVQQLQALPYPSLICNMPCLP